MALVSFPDGSYLEVMGVQPKADAAAVGAHEWSKFLRENGGPCAWALREHDLNAEVARLKALGVPVSAPVNSGRERPDGVRLRWQTSNIGDEARGAFFPFLIEDLTPREQRVYPSGKPVTTAFRGISRVVIAVKNLDDAVRRYRKAFGLAEPLRLDHGELGAHLAVMTGSPVVLATPLNGRSWLAERLEKFGESPCAFVLASSGGSLPHAGAQSDWHGVKVAWLDPGWRLGVESVR
jgi:catechol 2,3-dioxygenase-like lactoylglutathione lyase family enzyme